MKNHLYGNTDIFADAREKMKMVLSSKLKKNFTVISLSLRKREKGFITQIGSNSLRQDACQLYLGGSKEMVLI